MNKIDIKSLLIGFLSCLVLVLIVGFKSIAPSVGLGTYQGFGGSDGQQYLINTHTGKLWVKGAYRWKHEISGF